MWVCAGVGVWECLHSRLCGVSVSRLVQAVCSPLERSMLKAEGQ